MTYTQSNIGRKVHSGENDEPLEAISPLNRLKDILLLFCYPAQHQLPRPLQTHCVKLPWKLMILMLEAQMFIGSTIMDCPWYLGLEDILCSFHYLV